MTQALIVGHSGGIGAALGAQLTQRGVSVTGLSRSGDGLDVTDPGSVAQHVGRLSGAYDLIVVATGQLESAGRRPEKAIAEVSREALVDQFLVNAVGPMLVVQQCLRLLPLERRSVIAVLSARVGSIGDNRLGGWHSYRTSKAALNMLIHGAALELKRTHKQACAVCLHPGTVATPFTAAYAGAHKTVPPEEAAANLLGVIDGLTPARSGGFYDYSGAQIPW